jgi:hypothetical protein
MINKAKGMKFEDMEKVRKLSEKHFPDLEIPDFMNNYYCSFVITDDDDEIVIAGGLRPSAEILLVTNKDMSNIKIVKALIEAQKASLYVGRKFGLNELVAFVKDDDAYTRHLIKYGFYPRNNALAIKVPKWVNQNKTNS